MGTQEADRQMEGIKVVFQNFATHKTQVEKLNSFAGVAMQLTELVNFPDFLTAIAFQFKNIMDCESVHLWLIDSTTGTFYTNDQNGKQIQAYYGIGLFAELVMKKTILNCFNEKSIIIYRNAETQRDSISDGGILFPIIFDEKLEGILEFSHMAIETTNPVQVYYFANLVKLLVQRMYYRIQCSELIRVELKYQSFLFDSFRELCQVNNVKEFTKVFQKFAKNIFSSPQVDILFVEQGKFIRYMDFGTVKDYPIDLGVAGQVYLSRRSMILANKEINEKFHTEIDLDTTLPVFYYPIRACRSFKIHSQYETADVVAITMITMSKRTLISNEQIQDIGYIAQFFTPSEIMENIAQSFCDLASLAYYYVRMNLMYEQREGDSSVRKSSV